MRGALHLVLVLLLWTARLCVAVLVAIIAIVAFGVAAVMVQDTILDATCTPADPVRIALDGVEYRIPATLRPFLDGEGVHTRYISDHIGRRKPQYCQSPDEAPAAVRSFSLDNTTLARLAAANPRFAKLAELGILVLSAAPPAPRAIPEPNGELVADGLFRRTGNSVDYELVSTGPLFFGAPVHADCRPSASPKPSHVCSVVGRLPSASRARVRILDRTHPLTDWPDTLAQVEALLRSFFTDTDVPR